MSMLHLQGGKHGLVNCANSALNGWYGSDTLTGKGGADNFVVSFFANNGIDTISDFNSAADSIHLVAGVFGGGLVAGANAILVRANNFANAIGNAPRFIYDTAGADPGLYFDANGGSASDAVLFTSSATIPTSVNRYHSDIGPAPGVSPT